MERRGTDRAGRSLSPDLLDLGADPALRRFRRADPHDPQRGRPAGRRRDLPRDHVRAAPQTLISRAARRVRSPSAAPEGSALPAR